jgi:putative DNA primase/helicase
MMVDRTRFPDPAIYYGVHEGLQLAGHGKWKTAECFAHGGKSLGINLETGGYVCRNPACGIHGGDVLDYHMARHGLGFIAALNDFGVQVENDRGHSGNITPIPPSRDRAIAPEPARDVRRYVAQLWRDSRELAGTVGAEYLMRARAVPLSPADGHLRFDPALPHRPTGQVDAALIGLITNILTGEQMGLHRTWITATGKADIEPARMVLGAKQGGCIRLWPDEAVTTCLGVAEGVETALSLALAMQPVWSLIDAGNLAAFPVLPGVECLTIAADNDAAGLKAANECAMRWTQAGRSVRLVIPPREGADLNDVAREAA